MGKYGLLIIFLSITNNVFSQDEAFKFKLDYDIPESPAFSIIDANPTTVMRGSAAKELAVNIANNFISNTKQESGVALDFNPYFIFGGRLKNISEYATNKFNLKRLLANTQMSFASVATEDFPEDNLVSGGIRITLFDNSDLLFDSQLGADISNALQNIGNPPPPGMTQDQYNLVSVQGLKDAYDKAEERVKTKKGGALSIGAAIANRAQGGYISSDSLIAYRNQVWMSGQYNFGKGTNLLGLAMLRNTTMTNEENVNEIMLGLGIRHLGKNINIGAEVIYSNEKDNLEINGNIELRYFKNILMAISIGSESENLTGNKLIVKPTLRYNLSQPEKK